NSLFARNPKFRFMGMVQLRKNKIYLLVLGGFVQQLLQPFILIPAVVIAIVGIDPNNPGIAIVLVPPMFRIGRRAVFRKTKVFKVEYRILFVIPQYGIDRHLRK